MRNGGETLAVHEAGHAVSAETASVALSSALMPMKSSPWTS
jgi:hypothetical protein